MSRISGDFSFVVAVVNGAWTRLVPNPADSTIPKTAGDQILLQNIGSGTVYIIKRAHDALDAPVVALPAATSVGALADAGLVAVVEHAQDLPLLAPLRSIPDFLRCSDYYAWTDDAAGGPVRICPIN
jgi:hypothetical protein